MQRIKALLKRIESLTQNDNTSAIDIDLMMEYTRSLYTQLIELRESALSAEDMNIPAPPFAAAEEDARPSPTTEAPAPIIHTAAAYEVEGLPVATAETDIPGEQVHPPTTTSETSYHVRPRKDIRKHIGINDKYQFISELFGNNKEAYDLVMTRINGFDDYHTAKEWLGERIHEEHHWASDNDTVQMFYAVLSQFFSSR